MQMKPIYPLTILTAVYAMSTLSLAQAAPMSVHSQTFTDGGTVPITMVGPGTECGNGKTQNPHVGWSNLPQGTQSIAILLFDPDAAQGQGVSHWVAYNIPASRDHLDQGEGAQTSQNITVGPNTAGAETYRGLCPPSGDEAHHYVLTVIASDQPAGSLRSGLDRAALLAYLKGHGLGAQSIVGRYGH